MARKRESIVDRFIINDGTTNLTGADEVTTTTTVNEKQNKKTEDTKPTTKKPDQKSNTKALPPVVDNNIEPQPADAFIDHFSYIPKAFEYLEEIHTILAEEAEREARASHYKRPLYWSTNTNITISSRRELAFLLDFLVDQSKAVKSRMITKILLYGIAEYLKKEQEEAERYRNREKKNIFDS